MKRGSTRYTNLWSHFFYDHYDGRCFVVRQQSVLWILKYYFKSVFFVCHYININTFLHKYPLGSLQKSKPLHKSLRKILQELLWRFSRSLCGISHGNFMGVSMQSVRIPPELMIYLNRNTFYDSSNIFLRFP